MRSKINDSINILQTLFSAKLTDFLVSMKVFYIKFSSSNQFRNFHILNDIGINLFVKKVEPSIELDLLDVFLYKEATLAGMLGIDLDRNDEENVNLGNFGNEDEVEESNTLDDSRFEEDIAGDEESRNKIKELRLNEKKKQEIWKAEKDLCVFVMKMFTLINLSMVENDFKKRVGLNKEKIGGLFERVVKQNQIELQTRPISGLQEVEVIQSESVDVDKGEAVDVPTTNDVGIEDSFILN